MTYGVEYFQPRGRQHRRFLSSARYPLEGVLSHKKWTFFIVFYCKLGGYNLTYLSYRQVGYPVCKYWSSYDLPPNTNRQIALNSYEKMPFKRTGVRGLFNI